MILLATVILILLVIALYEYVPNSRILTEVTTYEQSGEAKNVIGQISDTTSSDITNESIIKSYTVTESDLDRYKDTYKYDDGRGNPFENIVYNPLVMDESNGNSTSAGNTSTNTVTSTNSSNNATGYFESTGKNK